MPHISQLRLRVVKYAACQYICRKYRVYYCNAIIFAERGYVQVIGLDLVLRCERTLSAALLWGVARGSRVQVSVEESIAAATVGRHHRRDRSQMTFELR